MQFSLIKGFRYIKKSIINKVLNDNIFHSYLFFGKKGNPSLSFAIIFSTYANCINKSILDSCGTCYSCLSIFNFNNSSIFFIFPFINNNPNSFIKKWKSFLHSEIYGNSFDWINYLNLNNKNLTIPLERSRDIFKYINSNIESKYKIIIIWLPEYMNVNTSNSILKIIEEPSNDVIFFLVSLNISKILPTLLSRLNIINISLFKDKYINLIISDRYNLKNNYIFQITNISKGNLNKIIKLSKSVNFFNNSFNYFIEWMRICYSHDFLNIVEYSFFISKMKKEIQISFLSYIVFMFRNILLYNFYYKDLSNISNSSRRFLKKISKILYLNKIEILISKIEKMYLFIERNVNSKIIYLNLSLEISFTFKNNIF